MSTNAVLQPVQEQGWRGGFNNLLRKELGLWWSTKRWWKSALLWILMLNGIVALAFAATKSEPIPAGQSMLSMCLQVFFQVSPMALAIAGLILAQDTIIGERQMGTAAWIMSKPVARESYVLTKVLAHVVSLAVLGVVLPSIVLWPEVKLMTGELPALLPFLAGVGIVIVHTVYYQMLAITLGTFLQARGRVIGLGLGLVFAGQLVRQAAPWLLKVTPWGLDQLATAYATGAKVPAADTVPILVCILTIAAFLWVALDRFRHEDL